MAQMSPFRDRFEAGRALAAALAGESGYIGEEGDKTLVVVGLARGGMQVASEVAQSLRAPLDVVTVRKVGHPWQPEYAIGAVTAGGGVFVRAHDGLTQEQVDDAVAAALQRAEQLDRRLHDQHAPVAPRGRTVLLVDDGLATGATMIAAARWARAAGAARLLAAVPVGSRQAVGALRGEVDGLVCLHASDALGAVGFWYEDFSQVGDDEVLALLDEAKSRQATRDVEAA